LIYAVCIIIIIHNGFKNIDISSEYVKKIVEVERVSVDYLISLKLSISLNDTQTSILANELKIFPKNLHY